MNAIAQASSVSGPQLDNRRVLAGVVDLVIVALGAAVLLFAGDALSGDRGEVRGALGAVILGWALYYYFALESGHGQTVGKKLMKLRVVRADGRPAGMREVALRTILRVVDAVTVFAVLVVTGRRRQRIGDLAAGTIVVDASASPVAPPAAAVTEPVEEEEEVAEPVVSEEPFSTPTITLPARPAPPATLADIAPEAEAEPEPAVAEVEEEPVVVEEEPVVEDEPVVEEELVAEEEPVEEPVVEDEPVVADDEPMVEDAPVVEVEPADDVLPELTTPSLEELARDVAAAHVEPEAGAEEPADEEPDEPVTVKSVETVSAIDLVMGGAPEEDDSPEDAPNPV